ncbi:MAG: hypothetical protein EU551_02440 [Promethearchaeota archaeon]|nr:MAG: hypothetical protein EU551_02440 [Candidatus Lokiarchaeota archaeon]
MEIFRDHFDAIVLLINTIFLSILSIGAIWIIGVLYGENFLGIFNIIILITILISSDTIGIYLLVKRKSALFPILIMIIQAMLFLVLSFINLLIAIFLIFTIVAIGYSINKRNILPRFKTRGAIFLLLLIIGTIILLPASYFISKTSSITVPGIENPEFRVSFYCEFYNNQTISDNHLTIFEEHNSRIFLAINETQLTNNSMALNMTRRLNNANVSCYAWLLLNESEGYWAADSNVLEFEKLVNTFISWANNHSLEYDGIMIDSEPAFQRLNKLQTQLGSFNIFGALLDLRATATSGEHEFAKVKYEEIINSIKTNGYEAMMVGFPLPIDDIADGDDTIQNLMGVSTIPPSNWDYSSFMIYRTTFKEIIGIDFGAYMIYSYGNTLRKYFGNQSSISLSRCGVYPYDSIDSFINDAFIVKNLGFQEVIWWEFPLFDQKFGESGLINFLDAMEETQSVSFQFSPSITYLRYILILVDILGVL